MGGGTGDPSESRWLVKLNFTKGSKGRGRRK